MKKYILCCDWGTSSFRLQLTEIETGKIICSVVSQEGIANTFIKWKTVAHSQNRLEFYQDKLAERIAEISEQTDIETNYLPIVISGMASSSVGILELPYASLPFEIEGNQENVEWISASEQFPHDMLLISGVQSTNDVMRGEETQCIGLKSIVKSVGSPKNLLILPGTHSKHIYFEGTTMTHFETFITGELFSILLKYSLLKEAVEKPNYGYMPHHWEAFAFGIAEAKSSHLLYNLFKVRTRQLLGNRDKGDNYFYLSGLLIGSELKEIPEQEEQKIFLCSSNGLFEFYKKAIEELGLASRTSFISPEDMNDATVQGQIEIFKTNYYHDIKF